MTLMAPRALALVGAALVAAVVLPLLSSGWGSWTCATCAGALVLAGAANVEIARFLEGRRRVEQRPHRALSAWALGCALLLPAPWLLVTVPVTYAYAWWRGLRPDLIKWMGSAAFLVLAGEAAHLVFGEFSPAADDAPLAGTVRVLLGMGAAGATFLVVETALFFAVSRLNRPDQEEWLRRTLADPGFYLVEGQVLALGALSAFVWSTAPVLTVLTLPLWVSLQQAAMTAPLRDLAQHDDKTGLLRFDAWAGLARREVRRMQAQRRPWVLLFLDLDHFKLFNDRHGHLAGDAALVAVAELLSSHLRRQDLVARFGGEEFAALLVGTTQAEGEDVACRLRDAVADLRLQGSEAGGQGPPDGRDGSDRDDDRDRCDRSGGGFGTVRRPSAGQLLDRRLTASIGMVSVAAGQRVDLASALERADRAVYAAKRAGRNSVCLDGAAVPAARQPTESTRANSTDDERHPMTSATR